MFLVKEAVLLARSSMEEEEELDRLGEVNVLMELDLLELSLSGVTAMEFDLGEPRDFHVGSLGVCSELRLSDPVLWSGWSEFLLSDPVLCILLLQF